MRSMRASPTDAPWLTADAATTRVAIIGDVGGHAEALRLELVRLGADPDTGRLPADLLVIQVGDLVHRGPDSDQVISAVDRVLTEQPGQWLQLAGNHEAQYLRSPTFEWHQRLTDASVDTLRRWWQKGQMRAAVALRTSAGQVVVSHAGLTMVFWRDDLGAPHNASLAADRLNQLVSRGDRRLFRAGDLLNGGRPQVAAGPLWASAPTELVPDWLTTRVPFHQVHGHSTLFDWACGGFRDEVSDEIQLRTTLDPVAKHEVTAVEGGVIVGIDPGHRVEPELSWRSWEAAEWTSSASARNG